MREWHTRALIDVDWLKQPAETLDELVMNAARRDLQIVEGRILRIHVRKADFREILDDPILPEWMDHMLEITAVGCSE